MTKIVLDKADVENLKDLKKYANKTNDSLAIGSWINTSATDNVIDRLNFMLGIDWFNALKDLPQTFKEGSDFKDYHNSIKSFALYDIKYCQTVHDDPGAQEINQYPKPLSLDQIRKRINLLYKDLKQ